MAEILSDEQQLLVELQARYPGFLGKKRPARGALINKQSISEAVQALFEDTKHGKISLHTETKPYSLLVFRNISATVVTASVENEVIASKIKYHPRGIKGFAPRVRHTLYRMGWLDSLMEAPIKVQITEFSCERRVRDFYLYTRTGLHEDLSAIGTFPLNLEEQQKIASKLGISH